VTRKVFAVTFSARCGVRLDAQLIVESVHDALWGATIPLRGFHGAMPEQELDLFELPPADDIVLALSIRRTYVIGFW